MFLSYILQHDMSLMMLNMIIQLIPYLILESDQKEEFHFPTKKEENSDILFLGNF